MTDLAAPETDEPDLPELPDDGSATSEEVEAWMRAFLASPGSDNEALGEHLSEQGLHWAGPVELPLEDLHRLAGPPDQPAIEELDDDDLEVVEGMCASIDDGWEPPPFVVTYDDTHGQFVVEDGNHRAEALRRSGRTSHPCVVGFADEDQRDAVLG